MINKILLNNNLNNFYQIQQDYEKARKSIDKKDETNLLGSITLSGYGGAIGSKMFGITGSMLGTGIGNFANNKLNNILFS